MKVVTRKKKIYLFLIVILLVNLGILSTSISSLPWHVSNSLVTLGLLITTPILGLLTFFFIQKDLNHSDDKVTLAIPLIALLTNLLNLFLKNSDLTTDISLLITVLLIITTVSVSYPRTMSY